MCFGKMTMINLGARVRVFLRNVRGEVVVDRGPPVHERNDDDDDAFITELTSDHNPSLTSAFFAAA